MSVCFLTQIPAICGTIKCMKWEFSLDNAKLSARKESCFEEIHDKSKGVDLQRQKDISCQVLFMYVFGFFHCFLKHPAAQFSDSG